MRSYLLHWHLLPHHLMTHWIHDLTLWSCHMLHLMRLLNRHSLNLSMHILLLRHLLIHHLCSWSSHHLIRILLLWHLMWLRCILNLLWHFILSFLSLSSKCISFFSFLFLLIQLYAFLHINIKLSAFPIW